MSHEIRTPLNGIIGTMSLLDRSNLSQENLEFLKIIETSSSSLLTLVNDILDHAKIETGKMDLESIRFSLKESIQEITELFNYLATSKGIKMSLDFNQSLPSELMGDPGRLKQILSNLISNALKFTEKGEVKVKVELIEEGNDELITLRFKIKDTGKGIDSHTLAKLFSPFEQGDQSTRRMHGGTGLGLSISKSLVEMMDGEIGVNSTPGEGSEFWFIARFEVPSIPSQTKAALEELSEAHVLCFHRDLASLKYLKNELLNLNCQISETDQLLNLHLNKDPHFILINDTSVNESLPIKHFFQSLYPQADFIYLSNKGFRGESKKAWDESYRGYLTGDINMSILENTFKILGPGNEVDQIITRYSTQNIIHPDLKILICEDNSLNQKLLKKILNSMGYLNLDIEGNGLRGVKLAKEKAYDLILMDIRMPELDGIDATKIIRKDSLNTNTYIIAITGDMMASNKDKCLEAGMNDYLTKPFTKQQLLRFIQQLNLS
jgi:CheY-like chemotaxis protein/two-component sensor histidine kinase